MNFKNGLKKTLACFLVAVLLLTAAPLAGVADFDLSGVADWFSTTANAAYTEGYLEYEVSNRKATITDCDESISGELVIPSTLGGYPVTSIGNWAFKGCTSLTGVAIPDSVTSIGDSAFYGCAGLISITIPDSVTSIGIYAFSGCTGLTSITIPDSVTSIGYETFYRCTGLTSITIGNSVTSIDNCAFSGCTGLTSITIPNSVTSIGNHAFSGCTGLTSITISDSVTSIGGGAFSDCTGLTSITIPNSVTRISDGAFAGCTGLTSITIPDSVTSIRWYAFDGCTGLTSITIPDSVTSIGESAFRDCTGLTSIKIPDSVTSIGSSAFKGCTGLTSITIPDSVTSISEYAFRGCTRLTSITIPDSVTSIGQGAFEDCTGLTSITIPDSVTSIGKYAFRSCTRLTSITIPDSVTSIGYEAFCGCTGLTSITIPDSVTSIGEYAFRYCTGLTSVTIPDSVTSIGRYAFYGCTGLTSIIIPDSVTSIGDYAFSECTGLTSVTIPDSVTSIGSYAFYGCTGLTRVTICSSVTSIGKFAFFGCTGLTNIYYSGTSDEWEKIKTAFPSKVLNNATVHCTGDPSDPSGGTDPKDEVYDNYDDREEIEKELSNYSVIIGKMDSYVLGVVLNSGSSYISEVTVNGTEYPVSEKVLSESTAKSLENKNVFIAVKDGKVEWIDIIDEYVCEPYVEVSQPRYTYRETEGLKCVSDNKNITVKISYPLRYRMGMNSKSGMTTSIFYTSAFCEMLSNELLKCDLYDLSLSEVKVTSENSNLKLPVGNILTSTDKKTLKVCESIEYEISTEVSPSLTVGSDEANKELSFYVEAKTSKGTLSKRGNVVVSNPLYRSNNHPWDNKPSSGGDSQSDSDAQAKKAARILNNIPISLNGDISGSLYKLFTEEQLEAIAAVIYTEVAMYKAPKDSFKDTLSTKIIEKVFKCKTNILSFNQNEIALTFAVDTQWGEIKVEFTTKSNNFGLDGSDYAFFGNIYYEIVGGKAKNKLPKSISKSGFAGGLSGVDMEAFCKAVWSVAQGQLKSAYNKAYGDDLNKAANIIFGESVNKVLKHSKYGSVSGLVWKLLVTPSTTVTIECPVDVLIYDSDNKLVASFINDEMTSSSENVCLSIVDGAKTVQLFDDSYHIEYLPFAEGKMNITAEEYGFSGDLLNRTLIKDVPLSVGITYKQQIDNSYVEGSDYSLTSSKGEKYDADEYTTVFHTHVSDGTIYHSDASTCTVRGAEYKYCVICNDYYCELLPLADHIDSDNDGKCDTCGESLGTTPEEPENPSSNCSCACHKKGIVKFFFKIGLFFQKLFKKNKICKCGAKHY